MLLGARVPFLAEATTTAAAYLINICPSIALMKTPKEIWLGHSSRP